jgi:hypothetical protein
MPIFFIVVGVLLVIVGINDKMRELGALAKEDFAPSNNQPGFAQWLIAIFVIGSLGNIKSIKPVANAFLALVVVSMVIANRGFFNRFHSAITKSDLGPQNLDDVKAIFDGYRSQFTKVK